MKASTLVLLALLGFGNNIIDAWIFDDYTDTTGTAEITEHYTDTTSAGTLPAESFTTAFNPTAATETTELHTITTTRATNPIESIVTDYTTSGTTGTTEFFTTPGTSITTSTGSTTELHSTPSTTEGTTTPLRATSAKATPTTGIIINTTPSPHTESICPTGFDFDGEDMCYKALDGPYLSYDEADAHCRVYGGVVASIENDFQFTAVESHATFNNYYFLAGKQISDTNYVWPDGESIQKKYYIKGQPAVGSGPCTSYYKDGSVSGILADDCDIPRIDRGVMCQAVPFMECSPNLIENSQHGTIYSVNYGDHYFNDMNCTYTLRAASNQQVTIIFTDFQVEDVWDYVNIFEGSTNGQLLARITASSPNMMVQSSTNTMVVQFITDGSTYAAGWKADYYMGTTPATIYQSLSSGTITSPNYPNYYPMFFTQIYKLNYNSAYYYYGLNFTNFATYWNDYVAVYGGGSPYKMTNMIAGVYTTPQYYRTQTSNVMIVFNTGDVSGYTGWDLFYSLAQN